MTHLDSRFDRAQRDLLRLPEPPNNLTWLRLYALYKQATSGDVVGTPPDTANIIARYRYEAWAALAGTPPDAAKKSYIDIIESLKAGDTAP